jgi:hypothetical protein
MQLEFDLTKEDVIAFNMYHYAHSPSVRRKKWINLVWVIVVLVSVCVLAAIAVERSGGSADFLWTLLVSIPIYIACYPYLLRRAQRKVVERLIAEGQNRDQFGKKQVTITPIEITAAGELTSTTVRWKAVERIEVVEAYAYVYFSALQAVIVPRRAFSSDTEFSAWVETARKYITDERGAR